MAFFILIAVITTWYAWPNIRDAWKAKRWF